MRSISTDGAKNVINANTGFIGRINKEIENISKETNAATMHYSSTVMWKNSELGLRYDGRRFYSKLHSKIWVKSSPVSEFSC